MQHPDEGTIHAWLDGALSADDARAFEAHVAECARCAAAVTEARGLLAASSRILSALDSVPGGVLPASEPEIDEDGRVIPIGRSSIWRSPGWRAAAAIVLVGSVSWLATRSVGDRGESPVVSQTELSSVGAIEGAPPSPARAEADSTAPITGRSVASANRAAPPPASAPAPQVAAVPQAIPYAMPKLTGSPNVGAIGGAGASAKTAMAAQGAATGAQPAPMAARADEALREESRAADAGVVLRGAATAQARMKSSAPAGASGAASRMQPPRAAESGVEQLAGCYNIESATSQSSPPALRSAAALIPAQLELSPDRDPSAGGSWRILRPVPGAPPFVVAGRARWMATTVDSISLELAEGARSVSARFAVRGDSIHGSANVADPQLPGGGMVLGIHGLRMPCSTP